MIDFPLSYQYDQSATIYSTDAKHPSYYPANRQHSAPAPPTQRQQHHQAYSLPFLPIPMHLPFSFPAHSPASSPGPSPASLVFDPFADDSDSTASSDSRPSPDQHQPRLHKVERARQRDAMHRVVAWVDGVDYGYAPKAPAAPAMPAFYTPTPADTPFVYYSTSPSSSVSPTSADEPFVIYSTPLPGSAPAPAPAPVPAPMPATSQRRHQPAKSMSVPTLRSAPGRAQAHRRYVSLTSIREEDETRA